MFLHRLEKHLPVQERVPDLLELGSSESDGAMSVLVGPERCAGVRIELVDDSCERGEVRVLKRWVSRGDSPKNRTRRVLSPMKRSRWSRRQLTISGAVYVWIAHPRKEFHVCSKRSSVDGFVGVHSGVHTSPRLSSQWPPPAMRLSRSLSISATRSLPSTTKRLAPASLNVPRSSRHPAPAVRNKCASVRRSSEAANNPRSNFNFEEAGQPEEARGEESSEGRLVECGEQPGSTATAYQRQEEVRSLRCREGGPLLSPFRAPCCGRRLGCETGA